MTFTKQAHGSATKDTMPYVHWLPAVVGIANVSMDDAERIVGRDRLSRWYVAGESVEIAAMSLPVAMMAKESVNRAFETTLAEGIRFERRMFHAAFATEDQKEGMAAFVDKRKPAFKNR
jgi:enoyl-CoA hydratase/carnithine racemase